MGPTAALSQGTKALSFTVTEHQGKASNFPWGQMGSPERVFKHGGGGPIHRVGKGFTGSPWKLRGWMSCNGSHGVLAWLLAKLPRGRRGPGNMAQCPRLMALGTHCVAEWSRLPRERKCCKAFPDPPPVPAASPAWWRRQRAWMEMIQAW